MTKADITLAQEAAHRFLDHRLLVFEDGDHLMAGHEKEVEEVLRQFIDRAEALK